MIQYLSRYILALSDLLKPLNGLLYKNAEWSWGDEQQRLNELKRLVTSAPVFAYFEVNKETVVSGDASSYGIGGFLFQRHDDKLKPGAFFLENLNSCRNALRPDRERMPGLYMGM